MGELLRRQVPARGEEQEHGRALHGAPRRPPQRSAGPLEQQIRNLKGVRLIRWDLDNWVHDRGEWRTRAEP